MQYLRFKIQQRFCNECKLIRSEANSSPTRVKLTSKKKFRNCSMQIMLCEIQEVLSQCIIDSLTRHLLSSFKSQASIEGAEQLRVNDLLKVLSQVIIVTTVSNLHVCSKRCKPSPSNQSCHIITHITEERAQSFYKLLSH